MFTEISRMLPCYKWYEQREVSKDRDKHLPMLTYIFLHPAYEMNYVDIQHVIMLTWNIILSTCEIIYVNLRLNYAAYQHIILVTGNIILSTYEIIMLTCDLIMLHVNIIMLHVDIIYLACTGQSQVFRTLIKFNAMVKLTTC